MVITPRPAAFCLALLGCAVPTGTDTAAPAATSAASPTTAPVTSTVAAGPSTHELLTDAAGRFAGVEAAQIASAGGAGDLDGDGRSDLWISAPVAEDFAGVVYFVSGTAAPGEHVPSVDAEDRLVGPVSPASGELDSNIWSRTGTLVLPAGDVTGDGHGDVWTNDDETLRLFAGPFTGERVADPAIALATISGINPSGDWGPLEAVGGRDITGDGVGDLWLRTQHHTVSLLAGPFSGDIDPAGPAQLELLFPGCTHVNGLDVVGDMDGDGVLELLGGANTFMGCTDSWREEQPYAALVSADAIGLFDVVYGDGSGLEARFVEAFTGIGAIGDVNGDGHDDLAYGGLDTVHVLYGPVPVGDLVPSKIADLTLEGPDGVPMGSPIGLGDVNGDGFGDWMGVAVSGLAVVAGGTTGVGGEELLSMWTGDLGSARATLQVAGDVDGDQLQDLLFTSGAVETAAGPTTYLLFGSQLGL